MTETPVQAAEPPAAAPAGPSLIDEVARLIEEAKGHLAGGGGASDAVGAVIRAVELLAGL